MARPLRIQLAGAWYHVMNRGAAKKPIFLNDEQRLKFLYLLQSAWIKFKIEIHAYCLMTNHYHLIVRTPLPNLSESMRYLNSLYAQHFNFMNKIDGPLFRGRFKSLLVEDDEYLLELSRYIHLNPVEANICSQPSEYAWSSYNSYIKNVSRPWLIQDEVLQRFTGDDQTRRKRYREFVEANTLVSSRFLDDIEKLPVKGSKKLIEKIKTELPLKKNQEIPEEKRLLSMYTPSIEDVVHVVCDFYQVEPTAMTCSVRGRVNIPRAITMYLCVLLCQTSYTTIANSFGITRSGISTSVSKIKNELQNNKKIKKQVNEIMREFSQTST